MISTILIRFGLRKVTPSLVKEWIKSGKTRLICTFLQSHKTGSQKTIIETLHLSDLTLDIAKELFMIMTSGELVIAHLAQDLVKDYVIEDPLFIQRREVAQEVLQIRQKKEDNYVDYLSKSGSQDHILINKSKMKRLDKLRSQLKNRIG